jgi:L-glyceraldehyde 3-phosphate reductase
MFSRGIESDLLPHTAELGLGVIAFCPLAQGLLTDRYLNGIPADSRAGSPTGFLRPDRVTPDAVGKAQKLNALAKLRGQTLAQMALAWTVRLPAVTSALIGASRPEQIRENVQALKNGKFTDDELKQIDAILKG